MRILMLNYEFPPLGGGAANANYYLLKELSRDKKVTVDLITSSKEYAKTERFSDNIKIYRVNVNKKKLHFWRMSEIIKYTLKSYFLARKLSKKNKYNLCHCWFGWPPGIIGYLLRKKIPYIVALRGSDVPGYSKRLRILDKLVFRFISQVVWSNAKSVIANSEMLKQLALKTLNTRIKVIYNGIDTKEFKPKINRKSGSKIELVSTGRLIGRKGYKDLINSLDGLDNYFRLTLIGGGNQEDELKKMSKKMDVVFKGEMKHSMLANELQKADIFVLPSLNEGMSNSVLEAMASGLPVIVTKVGGTKELIKGNGFIVEKGSEESLRKALIIAKSNKKKLKIMGNKSRKIAEEMTWNKMAREYKEIYIKRCAE